MHRPWHVPLRHRMPHTPARRARAPACAPAPAPTGRADQRERLGREGREGGEAAEHAGQHEQVQAAVGLVLQPHQRHADQQAAEQLTNSVPSGNACQRWLSSRPAPQRSSERTPAPAPDSEPPAALRRPAARQRRSRRVVHRRCPSAPAPRRRPDARIDPARAVGRGLLLPERRLRLQVVHQELAGLERVAAMRRRDRHQHDLVARRQRADAVDRRATPRMSKRCDAPRRPSPRSPSRSCRGSARAPSADTLAPSLRSRTVPTKLATAPTPASPARSAATSAPRSKSAVWIVTALRMACDCQSAAGDRREECHLGAVAQRGAVVGHDLVERASARRGRAPAPRRVRRRARSAASRSAPSVVPAADLDRLARARAPRAATRNSAPGPSCSLQQQPPNGRNCTVSPRAIACRRRVVDQAVGPHRRGQHARALVREQISSPPSALRRARAGTRGARSACGQSKSARIAIGLRPRGRARPAARAAPAAPRAGR